MLPPEIGDPRIWSYWAGVTIQFVVAGWILFLAPHDIRHRVFALLVACNAAWDLAEGFTLVTAGPLSDAYHRADIIFDLWTCGALAAFFFVYPTPRPSARRAVFVIVPVTVVASLLVAWHPEWWDTQLIGGPVARGPLALLNLAWFPALVLGCVLLLRHVARSAQDDLGTLVVAAALLVYPLGNARSLGEGLTLSRVTPETDFLTIVGFVSILLSVVLYVACLALAVRRGGIRRALILVAATSLILVGIASASLRDVMPGYASVTFGVLVAYALARGRLFDIDLKIKWTISRGAIAAVFLAAFLIATQIAQNYLQGYGAIVGGLAAGALLFAVKPIERVAERLADRAMPRVRDTPEYVHARKGEVFRAALEGALSDGEVTLKEREILRRLQLELGIANVEARAMEEDVRSRSGARPTA